MNLETFSTDTFKFKGLGTTSFINPIESFAVSPDETTVFVIYDSAQITAYTLDLNEIGAANRPIGGAPLLDAPGMLAVNAFIPGNLTKLPVYTTLDFHSAEVVGVDVAVAKNIFATAGADKKLLVWNYMEKSCEISKTFQEDILSLSLHPLGFQIVVGFVTRMRLFVITGEDLIEEHKFPVKSCRSVHFSHAGHYIAAVVGNHIQIYSSVSHELVGTLKGHTGQIKSACWSRNDRQFISATNEGIIYEWSIEGLSRVFDNVNKGCNYYDITYCPGNEALAVGSDGQIRQIMSGTTSKEISQGPDRISCLAMSKPIKGPQNSFFNYLFGGTASGTIRVFNYPFVTGEYKEFAAHSAPVVGLRVSEDNHLISVGEDRIVFVWKITSANATEDLGENSRKLAFADLTLISSTFLDEQQQALADLENKYRSLKTSTDYEVHIRETQWEDRLKQQLVDAESKHQKEVARYEELQKAKAASEAQVC